MFGELTRDLRYAVRQFGRFLGFTTVALLALSLGIGATITVFKVVNAILVNPLPLERASELHRVSKTTASGGDRWLSVPELTTTREPRPDLVLFLPAVLFGVAPHDPATFGAATLVFLAISTLATVVPVRRATAVSPVVALRME